MSWLRLASASGSRRHANPAPVLEGMDVYDMRKEQCSGGWQSVIDTAADKTIIPVAAAERLGLSGSVGTEVLLVGPDGKQLTDQHGRPVKAPSIYVKLFQSDIGDVQVQAACLPRTTVLLGRDILKDFIFLFDGPGLRFKISRELTQLGDLDASV